MPSLEQMKIKDFLRDSTLNEREKRPNAGHYLPIALVQPLDFLTIQRKIPLPLLFLIPFKASILFRPFMSEIIRTVETSKQSLHFRKKR